METKSADIHFRVEPSLKKAVSKIAEKSGVKLADVMRYYMIKMKTMKRIPTMEEIYNQETLAAIEELETSKKLKSYNTHDELLKELGLDE